MSFRKPAASLRKVCLFSCLTEDSSPLIFAVLSLALALCSMRRSSRSRSSGRASIGSCATGEVAIASETSGVKPPEAELRVRKEFPPDPP
eukprot:CAMPEP_0115088120 /NCGR_PEP_ID=MMETSP0227-20121206/23782_2 /TAXON_ID=89957 /ORGANISM="Polarella glacialis, Strain CCMP 1383" /LENGTH=89 /DNA_ID=CAMNT_0002478289 /DNA_START=497 /DNA_END=763 /DNA_ORIENTATION=-